MPYKDKKTGIYKIVNIKNNKIYIGSAVNIYNRFSSHKNLLNNNKHFNSHLQNSWNMYKKECFVFSVVEECKKEFLVEREEYYIQLYTSNNREKGYNIRSKCDTNLGKKVSMETREKLRISHLGIKQTIESKEKIAKTLSKPIIQFDNNFNVINKYESIKNASEITGCCSRSISLCTTKKMKSHPRNIYFWCFENEFTNIDNFKKYIEKW